MRLPVRPRRATQSLRAPGQRMLQKAIIATVDLCIRYAVQVIGIAVVSTVIAGVYAADHFALDADVNHLISRDLPWRKREAAFDSYFPPKEETILAVIDAPTPELRASTRSTFAPFVRHWSPWDFCVFWSPCALRTLCEIPAALNALLRSGRSKS